MQYTACFTVCSSSCADQLFQYILQLFSKEYRNDSRRCLVCSQSVIISRIGCGFTKQICMLIDCF